MSDVTQDAISAVARAVARIAEIVRDETADTGLRRYKYATQASVLARVRPALAAEGLAIRFTQAVIDVSGEDSEGKWVGRDMCVTAHIYGLGCDSIVSGSALVPILGFQTTGGKRSIVDAQAMGSAQTYAMRYATLAVCGIAPQDDDDGEAASKKKDDPDSTPTRNVGNTTPPPKDGEPKTVRDVVIEVRERVAKDRTAYDVMTRAGMQLGTLNAALAAAARSLVGIDADITYSQRGRYVDLRDIVRAAAAPDGSAHVAPASLDAIAAANRAAVAAGMTQEQVRAWWKENCPVTAKATTETLAAMAAWAKGNA